MASFNFNTDKISAASKVSSENNSTSGQSFFNVFVWVLLGALFATGVTAVDLWGNRDQGNAPAPQNSQKQAPTALSVE
ncbi:MAG TPA: hypothetical protein DCE56_15795 [Cyanobacteria bacterium UBA8553]|nr:hypothetical protein [Cyanobacteria bacterium UBA8553]